MNPPGKIFSLIDCNNFYVSCERVFNRKFCNKPVVVLSINDGCIIARSNEAKALGIPMGAALHHYEGLLRSQNGIILSSNYPLYADMSNRVMQCLAEFTPDIECYSIDEAFLRFDRMPKQDLQVFTTHIRKTVLKHTGIPVSIGIGASKVLAKTANHIAKKKIVTGIFDLTQNQDAILQDLPVSDIWGIGSRLARRLQAIGILSALQLKKANSTLLKKNFGVVMERLVLELNGISCGDLEQAAIKKNILTSKSFGRSVTQLEEIEEALSNYVVTAVGKLRNQNSLSLGICVFIETSPFKEAQPYYNSHSKYFEQPTSDYGYIIGVAKKCLKAIFKQGKLYKKTGIILLDLIDEQTKQLSLFETNMLKRENLLLAFDEINDKYGINTLFFAAQGINRPWSSRSAWKTPRYTTNWNELMCAY